VNSYQYLTIIFNGLGFKLIISQAALYQEASTWSAFRVVTFATWEEGLMVQPSNPKHIRSLADVARKGTVLVNWEQRSGAESLLDQNLSETGRSAHQLKGRSELLGPIRGS